MTQARVEKSKRAKEILEKLSPEDATFLKTFILNDDETPSQIRKALEESEKELKKSERTLQEALSKSQANETELEGLLEGAKAVISGNKFSVTARSIFDTACKLTGAQSGYVALLDSTGKENEVLFLEAGGMPCTVDESLPMPIRGLRGEAYKSGKAAVDNDFSNSKWMKFMPEGHVRLKNVMFAPLMNSGKAVGLIGLANKTTDFTPNDMRIAEALGQLASVALDNSRKGDELKRERELYETILDTSRAIILLLDGDGNIVQYNKYTEELTGVALKDVKGKSWNDCFIPENEKGTIRKRLECVLDENDEDGEINSILTKDGKQLSIEWYNRRLKENNGVVGVLSVGVNITDRIELQKKLQQAEKMEAIGHLAGGIAHDFNNILAAIMGSTELAKGFLEKGKKIDKYLNNILDSTHRAKDLVYQILSFSRQNDEKRTPQYIRPIIKEVIQLMHAILPSTLEINSDLQQESKPVLANAIKIHEVVMNLCTNAAHAMSEKGTLEIQYTEEELTEPLRGRVGEINPGMYSVIRVQDYGKGISKDILDQIFNPFFTTKGVGEGTGMGLSVVFGVVKSHEGEIVVNSTLNKGTEFLIYFPQTDPPASPADCFGVNAD